ncbi:hypothetical protein PVK06_047147 [Gossypium arboreum]|uniref:Uncharacterized protein n=1 Tax=Gossypium arboreum TaxID=29729 RepID=A0ABR0MCK3_GOSAR|nr:hypothetical protein PVK06_047147 [Gossypium arboreum]
MEEVWRNLQFSWVLNNNNQGIWEWLTWVFNRGTSKQCQLFCCGLWIIWTSRNKFLYENKNTTSSDISNQIINCISKLQGVEEKILGLDSNRDLKQDEQRTTVIKKCQSTKYDRSIIEAFIRDIQSLKTQFQELGFHFIPKSENFFPHSTTREALKKGEDHYLEGGTPSYVRKAMERKKMRASD